MNPSYMTRVIGSKTKSFLITQKILKKLTCHRTSRKASLIIKLLKMLKKVGIQKKHLDHPLIGSNHMMKSINQKKAKRGDLNRMRAMKVMNKPHQQRLIVDQLKITRAIF